MNNNPHLKNENHSEFKRNEFKKETFQEKLVNVKNKFLITVKSYFNILKRNILNLKLRFTNRFLNKK